MAKFSHEVAFGLMPQSAEGTFNATLDAIAGTWSYTQGLLLGDPSAGARESGLSLGLGRGRRDKALIGSSFTRSLSDFLRADVPTLELTVPYCGNRNAASSPPVDADATPIAGLDALLQGAGLVGGAWGSGVGWRYVFGSTLPVSCLVYYNGNRLELLDCRVAFSIAFEPASIPILTAQVAVGSIKDHALAALPTLTYGPQATISAPSIVAVGNGWGDTRGFSELTLEVAQTFEDFPDSNALTGIVKEQSDRETRIAATLFADDTTDKGYEYAQLVETNQANLDPLSFTVGPAMVATVPATAVRVTVPDPELVAVDLEPLGTKAGYTVELLGRGTVGNDELELYFL